MKGIKLFTIAIFILLSTHIFSQTKIIFDTDFSGDADDLGALTMLHNFIDKGECELLGIMSWSNEQYAVAGIDAVNRFYNHPNIPIGQRKVPIHRQEWCYGKSIADNFPHELDNEKAHDATQLYRQLLTKSDDKSVIVVTVGPLKNIENLILSKGDDISRLTGKKLIDKKVKEFVIMGGRFPEGTKEWNFDGGMPGVTKNVIKNIKTPITFVGAQIGENIKTGKIFNAINPDTPLYKGFMHFSKNAPWVKSNFKGKILDNATYDQLAVLYAIRNGVGMYWDRIEGSYCQADEVGGNQWVVNKNSNHAYLELKKSNENMAVLIEDLMLDNPKTQVRNTLQMHPENSHYFLYKKKPLALITSAEHYGALINLDFDYKKYLETLSADGMNYTRIFMGSYFEKDGESFGIQHNTLGNSIEKIITPWELASTTNGTIKYNLDKWNSSYFERLKDFMHIANDNNIIVEITLFSSFYLKRHWDLSPLNPINNINISNEILFKDAQILKHKNLNDYQFKYVQKMVNELNEFDNFFFEIQNEPWADNSVSVYNIVNRDSINIKDWTLKADFANEKSLLWQQEIAITIVAEESKLAKKHLIAQNYTNFKAPIPVVDDNISIINFHYAWPEAVQWNYHFDKIIGFDESGFVGTGNQVYRRQAWQFMLSGGGLFNNLDYSFFVGNEDGLGQNKAPGGGSKILRKQLKILSNFLHDFNLEKLYPNHNCIKSSPGLIPYILSDSNNEYAIFLRAIGTKKTTLQLKTGNGSYRVQTLNTINGLFSKSNLIEAKDGIINIELDIPEGELAIKITRE